MMEQEKRRLREEKGQQETEDKEKNDAVRNLSRQDEVGEC